MTQTTKSDDQQSKQRSSQDIEGVGLSTEAGLKASVLPSSTDEAAILEQTSLNFDQLEAEYAKKNKRSQSAIQRQRHGNAIDKQKFQAKVDAAEQNNQEFEYHYDRILIVAIIALVFLTIFGWGFYWVSSNQSQTEDRLTPEQSELLDARLQASLPPEALEAPQAPTMALETASSPETVSNPEAAQEPSSLEQELAALDAAVERQNESEPESASKTPLAESLEDVSIAEDSIAENTAADNAAAQASTAEASAPQAIDVTPENVEQSALEQSTPKPTTEPEPVNQVAQDSGITQVGDEPQGSTILIADRVARVALAEAVADFEPVNVYENSVVRLDGNDIIRVYWFSQLVNLTNQTVTHEWFYEGQLMASVNISVGGPSWRASTNKAITSSATGNWSVRAVDSNGQVLAKQGFKVFP